MADVEKQVGALRMIAQDMERDVADLDGKPFNGVTVAAAVGNLAAAISAIANIVAQHITAGVIQPPPTMTIDERFAAERAWDKRVAEGKKT